MEQSKLKELIKLAYCETLEERIARYRQLGLSEDEIDKLVLDLPSGFQKGQKLFTQEDVTKFRNDERRKVEANYKNTPPVVTPPVVPNPNPNEPVVGGQQTPNQIPTPTQGLTQEQIQTMIQNSIAESVKTALETQKVEYESQITGLKQTLDSVSTSYNADKQKAFETRKAQILAELPETVHPLLIGDTIEALETSYNSVKAFVEKTKQEAQTAVTAQEAQKVHSTTVFYKAEDGTEYMSVADLVKNPAHLAEWKTKH